MTMRNTMLTPIIYTDLSCEAASELGIYMVIHTIFPMGMGTK